MLAQFTTAAAAYRKTSSSSPSNDDEQQQAWPSSPLNSNSSQTKPVKENNNEYNTTDYSIFVGYGAKAKRVKDRWEATKRLLRFENNYAALKWLLDSFVDEYLRSKQMNDTVAMTAEPAAPLAPSEERRSGETSVLTYGRRPAVRSPPKTRFEEVQERHETITMSKKPATMPSAAEQPRTVITATEHRPGESGAHRAEKRYMQHSSVADGPYSYKYLQGYWPPYYPWSHGGMPAVNPRLVPQGYPASGYMVKTSSCSALPVQRQGMDSLKRWGSATGVSDEKVEGEREAKRPAVKLGFKTKSMPNLQYIPKDGDQSEDEDDVESDPESQGDLVALSSSSLSMPNLQRIPSDRTPLLSPPAAVAPAAPGRRYEPPFMHDRRVICPTSSFSMPNLQAIHDARAEDRKKTIRAFVENRLTRNDPDRTKIFNPNGYYMPARTHEPDNKRVKQDIRRRLLQRIEAKRQIQETRSETEKRPVNKLPKISEHVVFGKMRVDHNDNTWKIPGERLVKGISWDDDQSKAQKSDSRIWNPADVHVKKESLDEPAATSSCAEKDDMTAPTADGAATNDRSPPMQVGDENTEDEKVDNSEEDEEDESVDVENVERDGGGTDDSDGGVEDELGPDGQSNKRTRKADHPRKRLKAM